MNIRISTIIGSTFAVVVIVIISLFLDFSGENYHNYNNNNILKNQDLEIFAQTQEINNRPPPPVVKNSKILNFSGVNYADVVNSSNINLNSLS